MAGMDVDVAGKLVVESDARHPFVGTARAPEAKLTYDIDQFVNIGFGPLPADPNAFSWKVSLVFR
jgi:hypothetical protein